MEVQIWNIVETGLMQKLPGILAGIAVFGLTVLFSGRLARRLARYATRNMDDKLLASFLTNSARWVLLILGVALSLQLGGLSGIASGILAGASVSAIVVGFAFKDIGENLLAGVMLAINRPFKVGDVIATNKFEGEVIALDIKHTQIRSQDDKDIFIPNALIVKQPLENFSNRGSIRHTVDLKVSRELDLTDVEAKLLEMLSQNKLVSTLKKPFMSIAEVDRDNYKISLHYWLKTLDMQRKTLQQTGEILLQCRRLVDSLSDNKPE